MVRPVIGLATGGHVGVDVLEETAARVDLAVGTTDVLAQEHLVRGVRGVGLALIDRRCDGVGAVVREGIVGGAEDAVGAGAANHGGAVQDHEIVARGAPKRIILLQRDHDDAVAALVHEVEAVVEELAKEREPAIEWRRDAAIWRDVVDDVAAVLEHRGDRAALQRRHYGGLRGGGSQRRWVVGALIRDQVADHARVAVQNDAAGLGVGADVDAAIVVGGHAKNLRREAREKLVGGAEVTLPADRAVVGGRDLAQAEGQVRIDRRLARLGHFDLLEDVAQVDPVEVDALSVARLGRRGRGFGHSQWIGGLTSKVRRCAGASDVQNVEVERAGDAVGGLGDEPDHERIIGGADTDAEGAIDARQQCASE